MALDACIEEIFTAAAGKLTREEATQLLETFEKVTKKLSTEDKFLQLTDILERAKQEMTDRSQVALLHERATRTRLVLQEQQLNQHFKMVPKERVNAVFDSFQKLFLEKESIIETTRREVPWWMTTQMEKAGADAVQAFKTPELFLEALDMFFEPRASRELSNVPERVRALIGVFDSTTDFIYTAANKVGGYLNWRPTTLFSGRVALPEKVGAFTKAQFIERVRGMLSDDADTLLQHGILTDKGMTERLGHIYDLSVKGDMDLSTGAFADGVQPLVKTFYGKTVNKLSDSLFDLPFKNGAAYRDYFGEFNGGDISEHMLSNLRFIGRNLGLVRAFGPVPELGFKTMMSAAKRAAANEAEQLRIEGKFVAGIGKEETRSGKWLHIGPGADIVEKGLKIAKAWLTEPSPDTRFKMLTGETDIIHDKALANLGKTTRGFVSLSKLIGFGHLTQWGDLPTTMAMLGQVSDSPLTAFKSTWEAYLKGYDPNIKMDLASLRALGASLDVMHGNQLDLYFSGDGNPESTQRIGWFDKAFKFTGMSRLDWVRIKAINEFVNSHAASALEQPFAEVRPELAKMFSNAGIGEGDWEALKGAVHNVDTLDGQPHLLPELIEDPELRFKYLRMLKEVNQVAVPRPGNMEQALITRGTRPGTVEGELLRTIGLFKSFGIAMATRVLPFVSENLTWKGRISWGISMMLTYLMRDAVKQTLLGRTPKNPADLNTWKEALIFSGMGGVYGDLIGSDMSKFGSTGGVAGALAGPLIGGPVQQGVDWWSSMLSGQDIGAKEAKTIQTALKLSGANSLPIVTAVLNRAIIFNTMEALHPGWMNDHINGLKARGQAEF